MKTSQASCLFIKKAKKSRRGVSQDFLKILLYKQDILKMHPFVGYEGLNILCSSLITNIL